MSGEEHVYALISVYDKKGITDCAKNLVDSGLKILSTGGTAEYLEKDGIEVLRTEDLMGTPSILSGRVKTMDPKIVGGILAKRDNSRHIEQMREHGIPQIPVVIVNLYPFRETVQKKGVEEDEAVENIDIGGVTLLRASAKNFKDVLVICDPGDYGNASRWQELEMGERRKFAVKAWRVVIEYHLSILNYTKKTDDDGREPSFISQR